MTKKLAAPEAPRKILSAAEIRTASRKARAYVEAPALGGVVPIRGMSVAQAERFLGSSTEERAAIMFQQIPYCILDENDERAFKSDEEIKEFMDDMPFDLFMDLTNAIVKASGLDAKVKTEKNDSGGIGGDASSSA